MAPQKARARRAPARRSAPETGVLGDRSSPLGLEPGSGLPARLIQLVARFRPDADGVGETALRLADALWKDHGIGSDFLVYNPPRPDPALVMPGNSPHTIARLDCGKAAALRSALDRLTAGTDLPPVLVVHYASYGYSRHGTPFWLPAELERFASRGGRVITLFHELYAWRPFPSRTFFTSILQKQIFERTLAATGAVFTSNEKFVEIIGESRRARGPATLIGICSSAGEPENPGPLRLRKQRLTVFGRFETRRQLYALHLTTLEQLARHLGIEEIADIGAIDDEPWMEENVARRVGPLLRKYGTLTVDEVSRLLEDSVAGALAYPYALVGKSSVAAAYQAHAMAILLFPVAANGTQDQPVAWPLNAGELLDLPAQSAALQTRLQQSADAGYEHYRQFRSAHAMAETILPALQVAVAPR
jgi:hypothetical protein